MKTVNIALIWAFSFEGALTTTGQHIRGSLIKDETNNLGGDREVVSDPIFSHLASWDTEKTVDLWSDDHLDDVLSVYNKSHTDDIDDRDTKVLEFNHRHTETATQIIVRNQCTEKIEVVAFYHNGFQ